MHCTSEIFKQVFHQISKQWFSSGADFASHRSFGSICRCFDCPHRDGEGLLLSDTGMSPGILPNTLQCTEQPLPQHNCLVHHVSVAKVEKSYFNAIVTFLM